MLSAIYAKLLVVVCVAIVSTEVLTHRVPLYYYEGFFTFLYGVSILFLIYAYIFLLRSSSSTRRKRSSSSRKEPLLQPSPAKGEPTKEDMMEASLVDNNPSVGGTLKRKKRIYEFRPKHGSIFLRIGAIAFGLGTMIYIGLELGSFFEIPESSPCYDLLRGLNPILQVVFTFTQMYFIFMNTQLKVNKFKACARFGLMHIVATNICVWIRTVLRESKKDWVSFAEGDTSEYHEDAQILRHIGNQTNVTSCDRTNIMGTIVADSAPYLYPFVYEYSLVAAVIIFVMWRNIGRSRTAIETTTVVDEEVFNPPEDVVATNPAKAAEAEADADGAADASPDSADEAALAGSTTSTASKVDCVGSSKGLFFGLFVLVATTISLILFFVLVNVIDFRRMALFFVEVSECGVMALTLLAMMVGFARVQTLKFLQNGDLLGDLLLRVGTFGIYLYSTFGLIAGALSAVESEPNLLVLITAGTTILQATIQTLFVSDLGRRASYLSEHERVKPGRQIVTFLLICNLTLWVVETFEMQRVQANPVQIDFYGELAWASIQRITLPLTIFYRFISSVLLAEAWKNAYRLY